MAAMLNVIFTLDYEIHGNGEGCPYELMVEPTRRMLDLFDEYGAKLTIMADVAEILKFKEYKEQRGRDDYHYEAIADSFVKPSGADTTCNFIFMLPILTRVMKMAAGRRTGRNTILPGCLWNG